MTAREEETRILRTPRGGFPPLRHGSDDESCPSSPKASPGHAAQTALASRRLTQAGPPLNGDTLGLRALLPPEGWGPGPVRMTETVPGGLQALQARPPSSGKLTALR